MGEGDRLILAAHSRKWNLFFEGGEGEKGPCLCFATAVVCSRRLDQMLLWWYHEAVQHPLLNVERSFQYSQQRVTKTVANCAFWGGGAWVVVALRSERLKNKTWPDLVVAPVGLNSAQIWLWIPRHLMVIMLRDV